MTSRTLCGIVLVTLGPALASCGGPTSAAAPTAPAAVTVQPPPPPTTPVPASTFFYGPHYILTDVTLSGVVFEVTPTGRVPVEGAEVYCDACGPTGHTSVKTNEGGFYGFRGLWLEPRVATPLIVRRDGYEVIGSAGNYPAGSTSVMVSADTTFDIRLLRR